jgi:ATP-dependent DNA helicase RecG
MFGNGADYNEFYAALPFEPTAAQRRVIAEAEADITAGKQMNRMLQGDVGSGKTLVAAALIWRVCQAGYQAAFMAPTEILAEQHFNTLSKIFAPFGIRTVLLRGGMTAKEKAEARKLLSSGEARLAIGTHALISKDTKFFKLALAITDEQHRFGVAQRAALTAKSVEKAHVLVMSATPIPRTLALYMYGDLDVSVIDELPPGRQVIQTNFVGENTRARVVAFVERQCAEGRQVYIVCPAIDDNPDMDMKSVHSYADKLQKQLPNRKIGILHGKMKSAEKDAVMSKFADGDLDVLVSTTVVEVGMDVPNAALMIIENAERFGLSQLHQLRGRVGRGEYQSYCVLMYGWEGADKSVEDGGVKSAEGENDDAKKARERLRAFCDTNDGFQIAEIDLKARGPGDLLGQRQHGNMSLKFTRFITTDILREAHRAAETAVIEPNGELERRITALLQYDAA